MNKRMQSLIRNEDGQGMTEYIIIVALIAVAAIGVVTIFGQNLRALFAASAQALNGNENTNVGSTGSQGGIAAQRKGIKTAFKNQQGSY